eukprot:XP_015158179.2 evolutionarily conserved signaling intermediate in Toll pathway, mitochondrial isoform X1 [Gallus gallus]
MRLSWARALPLRLWGGCGAPKAARPMCHRSADSGPEPPSDRGPQPTARDEEPGGGPAAFAAALTELERTPGRRLGRLELVAAALAAMPALGVARQLDAYNRLLRLLPRGPWVPRGPLHRLFAPFPRQQECGLQVLEQMERYGVVPDAETRFLLLAIFGPRSRPVRKCQRMLYWLPRMRHANPYPLPAQLPPPGLAAACLGLRRIANDPDARLSVYQGQNDRRMYLPACFSSSPSQRRGTTRALRSPTSSASRAQNSRSCWPGMARNAPSLWRALSHCGCAAPACSTTCCGGTLSPPICGNLPLTLSAAFTIPCTLTWTWSVARGTTTSSMWMRWRRAPSSRCAWQGMATSTPWPSGSRGCSRPTPSLAERRCSSASGRGIPLPAPPETGMLCAWRGRGQPSWSPPRRRGAGGHRERGEGASLGGPLAGSWVNKRRRCGRRELCVVWGALRGETWC